MTMKEFAATMNKAAEIYGGEILQCHNGLDGKLHIQLTKANFDRLNLPVTGAFPYESPECQGDWQVQKQVDDIVFFVYHKGAYVKEVA